MGMTEAPRGALGHWVKIKDGRIENYQCVVPTTWNGSPRDAAGNIGAFEASLMDTKMERPGRAGRNPAHAAQLRSLPGLFDPCDVARRVGTDPRQSPLREETDEETCTFHCTGGPGRRRRWPIPGMATPSASCTGCSIRSSGRITCWRCWRWGCGRALCCRSRFWAGAATFLAAMAAGAGLSWAGVGAPGGGDADRRLGRGVRPAGAGRASRGQARRLTSASLAAIALFAACHGHAHATEATGAVALPIWAGFLISTAALHLAGIGIARTVAQLGGSGWCSAALGGGDCRGRAFLLVG